MALTTRDASWSLMTEGPSRHHQQTQHNAPVPTALQDFAQLNSPTTICARPRLQPLPFDAPSHVPSPPKDRPVPLPPSQHHMSQLVKYFIRDTTDPPRSYQTGSEVERAANLVVAFSELPSKHRKVSPPVDHARSEREKGRGRPGSSNQSAMTVQKWTNQKLTGTLSLASSPYVGNRPAPTRTPSLFRSRRPAQSHARKTPRCCSCCVTALERTPRILFASLPPLPPIR